MGRPPAVGLRYTNWDVAVLDHDDTFAKLLGTQGSRGFLVYFAIYQRAAASTGYYYKWDEFSPAILAQKLGCGVTADCVMQTVTTCCRIGLFDDRLFGSAGVLTSRQLQQNFISAAKERRAAVQVERKYWLLGNELPKGFIWCGQKDVCPPTNPSLQAEQSLNDSKEKDILTPVAPTKGDCGKPGGKQGDGRPVSGASGTPPPTVQDGKRARQTVCTKLMKLYYQLTGVAFYADKEQRKAVYARMDRGATQSQMEAVMRYAVKSGLTPMQMYGEQWGWLVQFAGTGR